MDEDLEQRLVGDALSPSGDQPAGLAGCDAVPGQQILAGVVNPFGRIDGPALRRFGASSVSY